MQSRIKIQTFIPNWLGIQDRETNEQAIKPNLTTLLARENKNKKKIKITAKEENEKSKTPGVVLGEGQCPRNSESGPPCGPPDKESASITQ